MKKILALTLTLTLTLGGAALAAEPSMPIIPARPDDWPAASDQNVANGVAPINGQPAPENCYAVPVSGSYVGTITVDGAAVDLTGIPGAPSGYLPMRAVCEAAGAYVNWEAEENTAVFLLDGHDIQVDLDDLTVTCDFEPVEGLTAYLDPNGCTFLPADFLAGFQHIQIDRPSELSSVHYDILTNVFSEEESMAQAIAELAEANNLFQLDDATLEDYYFFHMDAYDELAAYQPMITSQPTTILVAHVKEGRMETAKEDFQAYLDAVQGTLGFYPATAEALKKAQIVESADGVHLLLVSTWESNDAAVALFHQTFPAP